MPFLKKGVLLPVKGIDFSIPSTFIDERSGFPANMRYWRGELRKRPGKTILNEQIDDATQIMGLGKLEKSTGDKHLIRASKTKLERLNTSLNTWDSIISTDFTGGDQNFFHFANVTEAGLLVITNGFDKIRKWTDSGNAVALGGNPPLAKYCCYLSPYLLIANLNDAGQLLPWAIDWCDTDNPEEWGAGNSGRRLLSDEPSALQNIVKLNEFVVGYKEESLWLGRKVDTSDVFQFDCIKTGLGLGSPRSVVDVEGRHFCMSFNDFFVWNGIRDESIGAPIRDYVFERLDRNRISRCFAIHVQELTEVWFYVIISGYDWPTEIWKYNYRTGFWYMDTCSELTSAIRWTKTFSESWDDDPGSWDSAQDIWDAAAGVSKWEDIIEGDKNGYCYTLDYTTTDDNGVAVDSRFDTKDFTGDILEFYKRWLRLDIEAKGVGKLYVYYSTDEGSTWKSIQATSSTVYLDMDGVYRRYVVYFDVIADKIRFRFRNNESGETFYIRDFYPYYAVKEAIR